MPTPKQTSWTLGGFLATLALLFGVHKATTPAPPVKTTPDSVIVAPGGTQSPPPAPETTVTPPPVTTPTPPVNGTVLAHDDFTTYGSTTDLLARVTKAVQGGTCTSNCLYTDAVNPTLASLDKSVLYNGHPTMKYFQPGGVANTPQLAIGIIPQQHVWFKAVIRWTPGWSTTGSGTNIDGNSASAAYKMLAWGFQGYDGSGRVEITNSTQYQLYWGVKSRTKGIVAPDVYGIAGNVSSEWTDGQWYTYILDVEQNGKTGTVSLYIGKGDAKPVLRATSTTSTSESTLPPVSYFNAGLNFNQIRKAGQDQSLNYGEWTVATGSNPFGI